MKFKLLMLISLLTSTISANGGQYNETSLEVEKSHLGIPQLVTTSRLLKIGESIKFRFYLPKDVNSEELVIYPQYLEKAYPGVSFKIDSGLDWLSKCDSDIINLDFKDNVAEITYKPEKTGSYMAKWRAGAETFYRYFSVIDNDWIVLCFSKVGDLFSEPSTISTGIPLDHYFPIESEPISDQNLAIKKLLDYHRLYGWLIIPHLQDLSKMSAEEQIDKHILYMNKVRQLLPDRNDGHCARIDMPWPHNNSEREYIEILDALGVNDYYCLSKSNSSSWKEMPKFPYFASFDCQKSDQALDLAIIVHQQNFCSGWYPTLPVSWRYNDSKGDWNKTINCLRTGMEELRVAAKLSEHPIFVNILYDSPKLPEQYSFWEKYLFQMTLKFPKEYKLAYARSLDISNYYRTHFKNTTRP